ncbi:hypothetical protein LR48_Vigan07g209400 [Vigna angularis]|uniref:Uncharacterized protein n=1 Tax=Phaseolus angularis TaxID=3914 RepID=A0A0L9UZU9_PHAAN|nr:hypothetical protein LR48_Vigan07g209400 [Vigna angularis]
MFDSSMCPFHSKPSKSRFFSVPLTPCLLHRRHSLPSSQCPGVTLYTPQEILFCQLIYNTLEIRSSFFQEREKKEVVPFFFLVSRNRGFLLFKKKRVLLLTNVVAHLRGWPKSLPATSPMLEVPLPPATFLPSRVMTPGLCPPPRPRLVPKLPHYATTNAHCHVAAGNPGCR